MNPVEKTVKKLFDNFLKPKEPLTLENVDGEVIPDLKEATLAYQDWTACSASAYFTDVYLLANGKWAILTQTIVPVHQGVTEDGPKWWEIVDDLFEVWERLSQGSFHDPNTAGKLLWSLGDLDGKFPTTTLYHYTVVDITKCKEREDLIPFLETLTP